MPSNKELYYNIGQGKFIPPEIRFHMAIRTLAGDSLDPTRQNLQSTIARWIRWSPPYLQNALFYQPFCEQQGLLVGTRIKTPIGEISTQTPRIPFLEQTDENLVGNIEWQHFIERHVLAPSQLLTSTQKVIFAIPNVDARYLPPDLRGFSRDMKVGGYKVGLSLVPEMTDKEAKELFGNATLSLTKIQEAINNPNF